MDRSTSSETATKIVNTEATDQVGVRANDLNSLAFSDIPIELDSDILRLFDQKPQSQQAAKQ